MTAILKRSNRSLSLEMIDIQDNSFGKNIERILESLIDLINKDTFKTSSDVRVAKEIKEIEALVFKRLGLNINLIVDKDLAAVLPFYSNKNHVFINPFFRGQFTIKDQEEILKKANNKKGYVDLKNAKVGGIFSEYKTMLYMNFFNLVKSYKMTASQITSVLLHELGHAFYVCEYADRLDSNNQILANVAKELLSGKKEKNLTYIYKELKVLDKDVTEKIVDEIANGNRVVAGYHLYNIIIKSSHSQVLNKKYDETSFEQLADNFAARFGYGRELVISLDKLTDYFGNPEKSLVWNSLGVIFSIIIPLNLTAAMISMMFNGLIFISAYYAFVLILIFSMSGDNYKDFTYDDLKIRYKRVRNQQIEILKSLDISNEEKTNLLESIYSIDDIINKTYEYRTALDKFMNIVRSSNKNTRSSIREQQLLEDLISNDLFLLSAEFSIKA